MPDVVHLRDFTAKPKPQAKHVPADNIVDMRDFTAAQELFILQELAKELDKPVEAPCDCGCAER